MFTLFGSGNRTIELRDSAKMSSSSSDSEDENLDLLRAAVDTSFISDGMFSKGIFP